VVITSTLHCVGMRCVDSMTEGTGSVLAQVHTCGEGRKEGSDDEEATTRKRRKDRGQGEEDTPLEQSSRLVFHSVS
jgi:hypothetical protein